MVTLVKLEMLLIATCIVNTVHVASQVVAPRARPSAQQAAASGLTTDHKVTV